MTPTFTSDWFSKEIPYWEYHVVPRLAGIAGARWLEVGSYEGRSALWTKEHVLPAPDSTLTCVDIFYPTLETSFDANLFGAAGVRKLKGYSREVLPTLVGQPGFHGAYLDGSHDELDMAGDLELVWPLLLDGGVLVIDDYGSETDSGVRRAVDPFLAYHKGNIQLLHVGWQVILVKAPPNLRHRTPGSFAAMLERLALRASPRTIVDVGASDGQWSLMAKNFWPRSEFLLIEANPVFSAQLAKYCEYSGGKYEVALAGASPGEALCRFREDNPYQGVDLVSTGDGKGLRPEGLRPEGLRPEGLRPEGLRPEGLRPEGLRPEGEKVRVVSVDQMVDRLQLPGPYLLKLDVHGHELAVLQGAQEVLKHVCAVVMEVYSWRQGPGSMRFWEICSYMEWLGFGPSDLCDPLYRPYDGRLCQVDMVFERIDAIGMNTPRYSW